MRRAAVLLVVMAGIGCTSVTPSPAPSPPTFAVPTRTPSQFGQECGTFKADSSDSFYADTSAVFQDESVPDWPTAEPGAVGLNRQLIERASDNAALSGDVRSLLIVKDGKLVWERYYGADASDAYLIASVSKSILGLLTGIAIEDGLLRMDTTLSEVLPESLLGAHGNLTIEHLLTMSAGLQLDEENGEFWYDDTPSEIPGEPNFVRAVLARESVDPPGTKFEYSTGLTQVLAAVLTEVTGQSVCQYAADRLLGPLGVDADGWLVEPGGYFAGGHSVFMTPRELATFGQLVLNGGEWGGEQLVPSDWLDRSLSERWDLGCRNLRPLHQGYGYLWWIQDIDGYTVWNASGWGGQEILLFPELGLEVVMTHDPTNAYQPGNRQIQVGNLIRAAVLDELPPKQNPRCPDVPFEMMSIRSDGTEREAIDDWPANALPGGWNATQDRIVVASDRSDLNSEIYTLTPDGLGQIRLTYEIETDLMPAWSPTGTFVVFAHGEPGNTDLYTIRSQGEHELTQLTNLEGFEESPSWSPDGESIAFIWNRDDEPNGFGAPGQLWSTAAEGTEGPRMMLDRLVAHPAWSPDGSRVAVELWDGVPSGGEPSIAVLDLTSLEVLELSPGFVPAWSPDGTQVAFVRGIDDNFDIYVMYDDGAGVVRLTEGAAFESIPTWSPDGQTIRFMSRGE